MTHSPAPLFDWQHRHQIEVLEAKRSSLIERCHALKRNCHRRVVLLARVAEVTTEILERERALIASVRDVKKSPSPDPSDHARTQGERGRKNSPHPTFANAKATLSHKWEKERTDTCFH